MEPKITTTQTNAIETSPTTNAIMSSSPCARVPGFANATRLTAANSPARPACEL